MKKEGKTDGGEYQQVTIFIIMTYQFVVGVGRCCVPSTEAVHEDKKRAFTINNLTEDDGCRNSQKDLFELRSKIGLGLKNLGIFEGRRQVLHASIVGAGL